MKIVSLFVALTLVCFALAPGTLATDLDSVVAGNNTADGAGVLISRTTGVNNAGFGFQALNKDTTGSKNTATGFRALYSNTTGAKNTATGVQALYFNNGSFNTADGFQALYNDTTGNGNTGSGYQALFSNRTGANNAAFGYISLYHNTGGFNTALGSQTLVNNSGFHNTAIGYQALAYNTTGEVNTAVGVYSQLNNNAGSANTSLGYKSLEVNTGTENIGIGEFGGDNLTTGDRNICIGNEGVAGEGYTTRIGTYQTAIYLAGIAGKTVGAGGSTCYVDNAGKLGVFLSARRFKTDIADMGPASEALLALRPVTFHYKPELDKTGIPQFGLIAEEVAKVNPDLVTHDAKGKLSTVRYEAVNVMLLNEFLKEHRKNEEQQATIAQQQKQIEALTAGLQKVSAQLQVSKAKPQTVLNNQ